MNTRVDRTQRCAVPILILLAVILACTLYTLGSRAITRSTYLRLAEAKAAVLAESLARTLGTECPELYAQGGPDPGILGVDTAEARRACAQRVAVLLREFRVQHLDLHDASGQVIFSSRGERVGQRIEGDPTFAAARVGAIASRYTAVTPTGSVFASTSGTQAVTFVPISAASNGAVLAVLGFYMNTEPELNEFLSSQMRLAAGLAAIPAVPAILGALIFFGRRRRSTPVIRYPAPPAIAPGSLSIAAQEAERKRVSRELHDGIGQYLNAIKMRLQNILTASPHALPGTVACQIDAVIVLVANTIDEVRRIALALRPSMLDDLGLLATLSWLGREFQSAHPGIDLTLQIDVDEQEVPDGLKTAVFRILQEALTNIAKHSQAEHVCIHLSASPSAEVAMLHLCIEDDGRGFDRRKVACGAAAGGGLGVPSMRERAELEGGTLQILSRPDAGTRICASWPLRAGAISDTSTPLRAG